MIQNAQARSIREGDLGPIVSETLGRHTLRPLCVFLEGEMGVGKSTSAREWVRAVAPRAQFHGSPSYPVLLEYEGGALLHADLYRIRSWGDLEERGVLERFEAVGQVLLVEWVSQVPGARAWLERSVLSRGGQCLEWKLEFDPQDSESRLLSVSEITAPPNRSARSPR